MKKITAWILLGLLFLGAPLLLAEETTKKKNVLKQIGAIEGRGVVNFVTIPGEVVYTVLSEKKEHPKAWPLTYVPRTLMNLVVRLCSSVNDLAVLPWYAAAAEDDAPLTRRFDLPDYVWQKE